MIEQFSWAANKEKLERARVAAGKDASEEDIKAAYEKLLGLVVPGYEVPEELPVEEVTEPKKKKK